LPAANAATPISAKSQQQLGQTLTQRGDPVRRGFNGPMGAWKFGVGVWRREDGLEMNGKEGRRTCDLRKLDFWGIIHWAKNPAMITSEVVFQSAFIPKLC
jgi:hypothetical protein